MQPTSRYFYLVILWLVFCCNIVYAKKTVNLLAELDASLTLFAKGYQQGGKNKLLPIAEALEAYLAKAPNANNYLLLGRAYFYAGMDQAALKSLTQSLKYNPNLADAYFFQGLVYYYLKDYLLAERKLQHAILLKDNNESYYLELARVLEKQQKLKTAQKTYQALLAFSPKSFRANYNMATLLAGKYHYEQATQYYLTALEAQPHHVDTLFNLGQIAQKQHNHTLALKYFLQVIKLTPNDGQAYAKVIQTYQALNKPFERDRMRDKLYLLWVNNKVKGLNGHNFYIREQFVYQKRNIIVLEYFTLTTELPRRYVFKIQDPLNQQFMSEISLGFYPDRLYYLDHDWPDGRHKSYTSFKSEPNYDDVRQQVLNILAKA